MNERLHGATGCPAQTGGTKLVCIPFGNHEVLVRLTEDDRFLGIVELRISRDFLSPQQKIACAGYLDVEEFYREQ